MVPLLQTLLPLAELTSLPVLEEDGLTEAADSQDPGDWTAGPRGCSRPASSAPTGRSCPGPQELIARDDHDPARQAGELLTRLAKEELVVAHVASHGEEATGVATERHRT